MIGDLIRSAANGDVDARHELGLIAAADASRLEPHLRELLEHGVLWPASLFRSAGGDLVQDIVDRLDAGRFSGSEGNALLAILVETRHELVDEAMRRWRERPPAGIDSSPEALAKEAGWIFDQQGNHHELCAPVAYELLIRPAPQRASSQTCPWCHSPLWTVWDLDTAQPEVAWALAHTAWSGRLRVDTCFLCTNFTPVYSAVTPEGTSTWSEHNRRPEFLQTGVEDPPALLPVVGVRRATAFLASARREGGSTLGGWPDWVHDPRFLDCPACGRTMDYVGLIGGADLDSGEGCYYVFLHAPCGIAGVSYHQT